MYSPHLLGLTEKLVKYILPFVLLCVKLCDPRMWFNDFFYHKGAQRFTKVLKGLLKYHCFTASSCQLIIYSLLLRANLQVSLM